MQCNTYFSLEKISKSILTHGPTATHVSRSNPPHHIRHMPDGGREGRDAPSDPLARASPRWRSRALSASFDGLRLRNRGDRPREAGSPK